MKGNLFILVIQLFCVSESKVFNSFLQMRILIFTFELI